MRISDWSSDLCSSDLLHRAQDFLRRGCGACVPALLAEHREHRCRSPWRGAPGETLLSARPLGQIGPNCGASRQSTGRRGTRGLIPQTSDRQVFGRPGFWKEAPAVRTSKIGRASCRERVCQYVWISVVAVSLKKKKKNTK